MAGDLIHEPLDREARRGAGYSPVGAVGGLVGAHRRRRDRVLVDPVGARQDAHGHPAVHGRGPREDRIGAHVDGDVSLERKDRAVVVEVSGHGVAVLSGVVRRYEVLTAVLDPFDGPAEPTCRQAAGHLLRIELGFDSEAAAHVGGDHLDRALGDAQRPGQPRTDQMGDLGCGVEPEPARAGVVFGYARPVLHGDAAVAPVVQLDRYPMRRRRAGVVESVGLDVSAHERVVLPARMQRRAARVEGRVDVHRRRQRVEIGHHQLGRVLSEVLVVGDDHGERLTHMAHTIHSKDRLSRLLEHVVARHAADLAVSEVRSDEHRPHALSGSGGFDVDAGHRGVRFVGPHEPRSEHPGRAQVGDVAAGAAQQPVVLASGDPRAEVAGCLVSCHRLVPEHR